MSDSHPTTTRTPDFLTVTELGEFLRISRVTVYRLIERRHLPFYRTEKKILFRLSDVEAYLERCRVATFDETMRKK